MTYMGENLVLLFLIISRHWVIENHLRNAKKLPQNDFRTGYSWKKFKIDQN